MVSVVIPAYNEEKTMHLCLEAFTDQTYKGDFEVIVVDNNSKDNTASVIKSYTKKAHVRYILETTKGAGPARARGFDEAKGDFILTTDADTIVPRNWIDDMVAPLQNSEVAAVTSPCTIGIQSPMRKRTFVFVELTTLKLHKLVRGHYWLGGFSYGVRRDTYIKAGKINKTLPNLDDVELSDRICKYGEIVFLKDLFVVSSDRRYKEGLIKGLVSYIRPFIEITYLGKKAAMKDYR